MNVSCHGDKGFKCPECGSTWFYTSKWDGVEGSTGKITKDSPNFGVCSDQFGKDCRFRWPRSEDDKHFKERCTCPEHLGGRVTVTH